MALKTGFPDCTPWKNYRYPLTRLLGRDELDETRYEIVTETGHFDHISGDRRSSLDIWISDDWFLHSDALSAIYKIVMYHHISADSCKTLQRPNVFVAGSAGTSTITVDPSAVDPHFLLGNSDSVTLLDVENSLARTYSKMGARQSLYTLIPGLHFGFRSLSKTGYGDGAEFSWTMKSTALDNIPKVMDGTYTCWFKSPEASGDAVVTEPLPSGITSRSFTVALNSKEHTIKRDASGTNWGTSLYIEGSIDKVNWFTIRKLIDDSEGTLMQTVQFDSNALDGHDALYKRIKIEFETGTGSEVGLHPHQFLELAITPN